MTRLAPVVCTRSENGLADLSPPQNWYGKAVPALAGDRRGLARGAGPPAQSKLPNVFITRQGRPWTPKAKTGDSPISKKTTKLLKDLKIHRPGLGFYALRHTFETIAGESKDQAAVDYIMGHAPHANDMSAVYRERMTNRRLFQVAKYVRRWLRRKSSPKTLQPVSA